MHDGQAYLLDVNKTIGAYSTPKSPELEAARRHRAPGIYDFFDGVNPRTPLSPQADTSAAPVRVQPAFEGDA